MLSHDSLNLPHFRVNCGGDLQNCLFSRISRLLREIAHVGIIISLHCSCIGLLVAQNDMKQGRLPRPVGSHQGNTLTPVDRQVGLLKEGPPTIGHG